MFIMFYSNLFCFAFKKLKNFEKNYDIVLISFYFNYIKNKKIDPNIIKMDRSFLYILVNYILFVIFVFSKFWLCCL